jgi:NADPH:quinone reductase-like Zn-dependent oxidoreductase
MRAYIVPAGCTTSAELKAVDRPDPRPGPNQVLVRVRAASLNYRDQAVALGVYMGGPITRDTIPLSDGAGEIVEVGPGVTRFKPGDRVAGLFTQIPPAGLPFAPRAALGSPLDGMLAELVVLYEDGVIPLPPELTFEQGACLPCAGVTAWHALMHAGRPVQAGDTVLVLGTGGVSILALQFAKVAGARVIVTSSSDDKIAKALALGASDGVNYKRTPEWNKEVMKLTEGRGADCVVEVGGVGTLNRSFQSLAFGGKVVLIGLLTGGGAGEINPYTLMPKWGSLHGIFVGNREMFESMNRAIEAARIRPVVDKVFPFADAHEAYRCQASGNFFSKVVIQVTSA